jgi:hypothetical protein
MENKEPETSLVRAVNSIREQVAYLKKDSNAPQYTYLSEAHLTNVIRPIAVVEGLIMSPNTTRNMQVHTSLGKNQNMHMVTWEQGFLLQHIYSGQSIQIEVPAQGMDSGDKAVWKGLTAAHKYAWMRLLFLETGDDPEADRSTDDIGSPPSASLSKELLAPAYHMAPPVKQALSQGTPAPSLGDDPELSTWLDEVGTGYNLSKDDMRMWGIWKLCFQTSEAHYGQMEQGDNRKMEPMRLFEALEGITRDNPFQSQHVLRYRNFCKFGYKNN